MKTVAKLNKKEIGEAIKAFVAQKTKGKVPPNGVILHLDGPENIEASVTYELD
ncbi:hypothetical protein [Pacificibacter marinus]|uniref:hypothetical protein n=1 Tax=Pacificibacter marinus TaxID=658057 RepID=UPI001C06F316|nr:hypothetical protein [Pacificibacter marinus]MBU2867843.1 hypothetical protein [Pacificibacter marinus]